MPPEAAIPLGAGSNMHESQEEHGITTELNMDSCQRMSPVFNHLKCQHVTMLGLGRASKFQALPAPLKDAFCTFCDLQGAVSGALSRPARVVCVSGGVGLGVGVPRGGDSNCAVCLGRCCGINLEIQVLDTFQVE